MFEQIKRVFSLPDLRKKILYVIAILVLARFLAHIPVPGVDISQLRDFFARNEIFGLLNMFTGGTMENFSIILMGVGPYITASIIMQLLTMIVPSIDALSKEGEYGREKLNHYTRIISFPLALIQSYAMITLIRNQGLIGTWTPFELITILISVSAGTMLLMWLGELISEFGIGNGISLIITLGIIFILTLIYFSYRFIVQPKTENVTQQNTVEANDIVSGENKIEDLNKILPATTTEIQIKTVDVLEKDSIDIASSSSVLINDILPPLIDSDSDGLNDLEEEIIGSDINLTDSDNDTFSDLSEIENGYNPIGSGKLVMNSNIAEYNGKAYSFLYPVVWGVSSLNNDETVIITTDDNSLIQISSQDNENVQSILSWYEEYFPDTLITYDKLKKGSGWEGIMSPDNINFYLVDDMRDKIYVISYIAAVGERVSYPNIFNFIINSFSIK